jgi:hypothetical protein
VSAARLGRLLLLVALLAGWQAALEHPLAHLDERGAFVHLEGGHSEHGGPLCDELAALGACASGAAQPLVVHERAEDRVAAAISPAPRLADAPPFLSQGPPARA